MGDVKNLSREAANKKIKEIIDSTDICFFTTGLTSLPLATRPMSTQKVEDDGSILFFSEKSSDKNKHIQKDNRVQLFYANKGKSEYLSIYGTATITKNEAKAKELWDPIEKIWFQGGYNDPELTIITVTTEDGYYWDTKDGRIVTLIKMAAGMIAGKELDMSIEGKINA